MNDQDPLAQLRDIHLPDSVGFWPPAPGWWVLAFIICAGIIFLIVRSLRHKHQNRYRIDALNTLNEAWNGFLKDNNAQVYLLQLTQIVKRTALSAYPNLSINVLKGQAWLSFLDNSDTASSKGFSQGPGKNLLTLPYQDHSVTNKLTPQDLQTLHKLCLAWIENHRPQSEMLKPKHKIASTSNLGTDNQGTDNPRHTNERGQPHVAS